MKLPGLALTFSLLAAAAGAQNLGGADAVAPAAGMNAPMAAPAGGGAMPGAAPAMPSATPAMPGATAGAMPMSAAAPPPSSPSAAGAPQPAGTMPTTAAGGGATAGIVGLRGAMSAKHGTVYESDLAGVNTQAFMKIENLSNNPDLLTSITCPIADGTTLIGADGKKLGTLPVAPGQPVTLAPKGMHVALRNTHFPIFDGSTVPCILTFKYAGQIQVLLQGTKAPTS